MNALEERLREALADRAAQSPIDPDAWEKTVARSRRGRRPGPIKRRRLRLALPRWSPAGVMIPVTAAAAVVAIILVAVSLTGGAPTRSRNLGTGSVSETATTPPSAGTPRQVTDLLRTNPAVTSIVSVKVGTNLVYVWFSNLTDDYLCYVVVGIPTPGGGDRACFSYTAPILKDTVLGPELITPITIGKAVMQATSITVRLSDGGFAPAAIVSGRGFPFKVCFANIPPQYSSTIVVRDAAGHEVAHDHTDVQVGTAATKVNYALGYTPRTSRA